MAYKAGNPEDFGLSNLKLASPSPGSASERAGPAPLSSPDELVRIYLLKHSDSFVSVNEMREKVTAPEHVQYAQKKR